jgi:hypothetical protein
MLRIHRETLYLSPHAEGQSNLQCMQVRHYLFLPMLPYLNLTQLEAEAWTAVEAT